MILMSCQVRRTPSVCSCSSVQQLWYEHTEQKFCLEIIVCWRASRTCRTRSFREPHFHVSVFIFRSRLSFFVSHVCRRCGNGCLLILSSLRPPIHREKVDVYGVYSFSIADLLTSHTPVASTQLSDAVEEEDTKKKKRRLIGQTRRQPRV